MQLKDRVAVVTGAGSGIGRAIAVRFAREGARIVIVNLDEEKGKETAEMVEEAGQESLVWPTDVGCADAVARLFQAMDKHHWPVDILVNNAGYAEKSLQPIWETDDQRWNEIINVHLKGTFHCSREALKRMVPRKQGIILNMASLAGFIGLAGGCSYTAAKGGIMALTKAMAHECAPHGIRVNCIAPGWIETSMLDHLPENWRSGMAKASPMGRIGKPDEVAGVAVFLCSDDASFMIGQVISPNGGIYR